MNPYRFGLLMLVLLSAFAYGDTSYGELAGDRALVFREDAHLFAEPRDTSDVVCSPPVGTELFRVAGVDMGYEGDGLRSSWVEASCILDGETYRGYIPQPWLAYTDAVLSGDTLFIFGLDSYFEDRSRLVGSARAVSRGDILWESVFFVPGTEATDGSWGYSVSCQETNHSGFDDMESLVLLSLSYEACGFVSKIIPFVWTGEYLIRGPEASRVAEAGIFHYTERLLLPAYTGLGDMLGVASLEETYDEDAEQYIPVASDTVFYLWTGLDFTP